jgi:hypothetical protein
MVLENAQAVRIAAETAESLTRTTAKLFESSMPELASALRARVSPAATLNFGEQTMGLAKLDGGSMASLSHPRLGSATMMRSERGDFGIAMPDGAGAVVKDGRVDLYSPTIDSTMRLDRNSVQVKTPRGEFSLNLDGERLVSSLNGTNFKGTSEYIPGIGSFKLDGGRATLGLHDGTELGIDKYTGAFVNRGVSGLNFFHAGHNLQDGRTTASIGSLGGLSPNPQLLMFEPGQPHLQIRANAHQLRPFSDFLA